MQGLRISSADGQINRTVATSRARSETQQRTQVVFNVYGEQHFLS